MKRSTTLILALILLPLTLQREIRANDLVFRPTEADEVVASFSDCGIQGDWDGRIVAHIPGNRSDGRLGARKLRFWVAGSPSKLSLNSALEQRSGTHRCAATAQSWRLQRGEAGSLPVGLGIGEPVTLWELIEERSAHSIDLSDNLPQTINTFVFQCGGLPLRGQSLMNIVRVEVWNGSGSSGMALESRSFADPSIVRALPTWQPALIGAGLAFFLSRWKRRAWTRFDVAHAPIARPHFRRSLATF